MFFFLFGNYEIKAGLHDAVNGIVNVAFLRHHTEKAGIFKAEFKVTFKDGRVETYPNDDYLEVNIMNNVGGN